MLITNAIIIDLQAIERTNYDDSWFTLVILFTVVLLAVLKLIKAEELKNYTLAFFTPAFFQKKAEEYIALFTPFHFILFTFSSIVLALVLYSFFEFPLYSGSAFLNYLGLLALLFLYLFLRYLLDIFLAYTLGIRKRINYFLFVKYGYLFSICLWTLPVLILYKYSFTNTTFLKYYPLFP